MSLVGKVFAVISLVMAIFYAGITAALVSLQENFKMKLENEMRAHADTKRTEERKFLDEQSIRKEVEAKNRGLVEEKGRLISQRDNLRNEWQDVHGRYKYARAIIDDQEHEMERLNAELHQYRDHLREKSLANDKLDERIKQLKAKRDELQKDRDKLQDLVTVREKDLNNTAKELEKTTRTLAYVNSLVLHMKKERPDLYRLAIEGKVIPPERVIRGKVIGVDDKLGLVIVNVGEHHEVQKGHSFIVFRGDKYVGKIIIDEVYPDNAAALYIRTHMKLPVEIGDDITTKLIWGL